jgi:hypothetical protein
VSEVLDQREILSFFFVSDSLGFYPTRGSACSKFSFLVALHGRGPVGICGNTLSIADVLRQGDIRETLEFIQNMEPPKTDFMSGEILVNRHCKIWCQSL